MWNSSRGAGKWCPENDFAWQNEQASLHSKKITIEEKESEAGRQGSKDTTP